MTLASTLYGPGQERLDRFHLNNLSFAGPVIMGIGGKEIGDSFNNVGKYISILPKNIVSQKVM